MTLPSSCTPARRAVVTALTTSTGQPRAIASDYLFRATSPAEVAQNPADVKKKPGVFVLFRDPVLDGEIENGSSIVVHYVAQITCWYWMGSDVLPARASGEVDVQLARIEADENRLRAALCYPGALLTDPSSNDTGLCGHALRSDGYRAVGPDPLPTQGDDAGRVLKVVHYFRASVDQLQPT